MKAAPKTTKTNTMIAVEKAHGGKDIRQVILDETPKYETRRQLASALGIDQSALYIWALKFGIRFKLQAEIEKP